MNSCGGPDLACTPLVWHLCSTRSASHNTSLLKRINVERKKNVSNHVNGKLSGRKKWRRKRSTRGRDNSSLFRSLWVSGDWSESCNPCCHTFSHIYVTFMWKGSSKYSVNTFKILCGWFLFLPLSDGGSRAAEIILTRKALQKKRDLCSGAGRGVEPGSDWIRAVSAPSSKSDRLKKFRHLLLISTRWHRVMVRSGRLFCT